jgi:hypothetical protein
MSSPEPSCLQNSKMNQGLKNNAVTRIIFISLSDAKGLVKMTHFLFLGKKEGRQVM